jgi:hypothetical protein
MTTQLKDRQRLRRALKGAVLLILAPQVALSFFPGFQTLEAIQALPAGATAATAFALDAARMALLALVALEVVRGPGRPAPLRDLAEELIDA